MRKGFGGQNGKKTNGSKMCLGEARHLTFFLSWAMSSFIEADLFSVLRRL